MDQRGVASADDLALLDRTALEARLAAVQAQLAARHVDRLTAAQTNPVAFCEYVLRDEKTGEPIVLDAMHRMWFAHIWTCWRRGLIPIILAPFGSGKTALVSIGLTLFLLGRDQTRRIKIISASDDLAVERVQLISRYIKDSAEYHQVFPHIRPSERQPWQAKRLFLERDTSSKDPSVHAVGAVSSAIGSRADDLILDDMNDLRNTLIFPKLRRTVFRNLTGVFLSRLEPKTGRVAAIATRWHVEDAVGMILRDPIMSQQYGLLVQAIADDFGSLECEIVLGNGGKPVPERDPILQLLDTLDPSWLGDPQRPDVPACRGDIPWAHEAAVHRHVRLPLWSLRFTPDNLRARYAEMSSREFDRGYRQRAISDEELLWRPQHLSQCLDRTHRVVDSVEAGSHWASVPIYFGIDLSISTQNASAAYFVIVVMAVDADGHRWVLHVYRERNLTFGQQCAVIRELALRFVPKLIKVESNGYQDAIRQQLGATTELPITGCYTGEAQKRDVEIGLPSLAAEFEHKRWHLPMGDTKSQRMLQPLVDEVASYPNGIYDDTVMALFFARECVRQPKAAEPRVFLLRF